MTNWRPPPPERRCKGTIVETGEQCIQWTIRGGLVCVTHGGRAPQVKRAAQHRLAEQSARKFLSDVDVEPIENPLEALAEHISEARAMYRFVADKVAGINVDAWESHSEQGPQLDAYVSLLERMMVSVERMLANWVKLGLDERLVRISEAETDLVVAALERTLASVELTPEVSTSMRLALVRELAKAS